MGLNTKDCIHLRLFVRRVGVGDLLWELPIGLLGLAEKCSAGEDLGCGYSGVRLHSRGKLVRFHLGQEFVPFAEDWRAIGEQAIRADARNVENLLTVTGSLCMMSGVRTNPISRLEVDWMRVCLGGRDNWVRGITLGDL